MNNICIITRNLTAIEIYIWVYRHRIFISICKLVIHYYIKLHKILFPCVIIILFTISYVEDKKVRYCGILQWKYSIVICLENNKMMNDLLQYCVSLTMLFNVLVIQYGWYMSNIRKNRKYFIAYTITFLY